MVFIYFFFVAYINQTTLAQNLLFNCLGVISDIVLQFSLSLRLDRLHIDDQYQSRLGQHCNSINWRFLFHHLQDFEVFNENYQWDEVINCWDKRLKDFTDLDFNFSHLKTHNLNVKFVFIVTIKDSIIFCDCTKQAWLHFNFTFLFFHDFQAVTFIVFVVRYFF